MIDVRPVETEADLDVYLELRNAIDPDRPYSHAVWEAGRDTPLRLALIAALDGEPAGVAACARHLADAASPLLHANVRVLRERRRRGVGTALFRGIGEHARAHGKTGIYTHVQDRDADSLDYLGKRGFEEVLRMQEVALELAEAEVETAAVEGVELVALAGRPELEPLLYRLALEIEPELEADVPFRPGPFEEWREQWLPATVLPACSFAAIAGGEAVGYAILGDEGGGLAAHHITGVRRGWRGRGLAGALKRAQIAAAKEAGFVELRTANDVRNLPMRRVNERLGFRPRSCHVHLRGPLI